MKYVKDVCRSLAVGDGTTIVGRLESPLPRNFKSCSAISAFNRGTDDLFAAYRTGLARQHEIDSNDYQHDRRYDEKILKRGKRSSFRFR